MWLRLIALSLTLSACGAPSFEVPHSDDARTECARYVDAIGARVVACEGTPNAEKMSALYDRCGKVLGPNPLGESIAGCIARLNATPCDQIASAPILPWCHAFLEP